MEKRERGTPVMHEEELSLGLAIGNFLHAKQAKRLTPKTIRNYNDHFRYLVSWLKKNHPHATLSTITGAMLREYVNWMTSEKKRYDDHPKKRQKIGIDGLSPTTVNMRIKTMRTFFNWCEKEGLVQHSPAIEIKLLKVDETEIWSLAERECLSNNACVLVQQLVAIFDRANKGFLSDQKKFILSDVSERSVCGEFMKYLTNVISKTSFSSYHVDVEYNRNDGKIKTIKDHSERVINITCDIIVHSRGENIQQDNLIAIEMKKSTLSQNEKNKDRDRLIALTKDIFDDVWTYDGKTFPEHVCRYGLGVYYEINIESRGVEIEYYVKGKLIHKYIINF